MYIFIVNAIIVKTFTTVLLQTNHNNCYHHHFFVPALQSPTAISGSDKVKIDVTNDIINNLLLSFSLEFKEDGLVNNLLT